MSVALTVGEGVRCRVGTLGYLGVVEIQDVTDMEAAAALTRHLHGVQQPAQSKAAFREQYKTPTPRPRD